MRERRRGRERERDRERERETKKNTIVYIYVYSEICTHTCICICKYVQREGERERERERIHTYMYMSRAMVGCNKNSLEYAEDSKYPGLGFETLMSAISAILCRSSISSSSSCSSWNSAGSLPCVSLQFFGVSRLCFSASSISSGGVSSFVCLIGSQASAL